MKAVSLALMMALATRQVVSLARMQQENKTKQRTSFVCHDKVGGPQGPTRFCLICKTLFYKSLFAMLYSSITFYVFH